MLENELRKVMERDFVAWPAWAIAGVMVVLGVVTVAAVALSRRLPWLATTASLLLLYATLKTIPSRLTDWLPYVSLLGLDWRISTVALMTGIALSAAVWAWWSYLRLPVQP